MKRLFILATLFFLFLPVPSGFAHIVWINIADDRPAPREPVEIELGWGYQFPKGIPMGEKYLDRVYVLDPSGNEVEVTRLSTERHSFTPRTEGEYRIAAVIHPGFVTKTTQGYRTKPKTDLEGVLSCFSYDIRAKTSVFVGTLSPKRMEPVGDLLEIVAEHDGSPLHPGEAIDLKVVFDGKPLTGARLEATHDGGSYSAETAAVVLTTDQHGMARLELSRAGNWLVTVTHVLPYPDTGVCDEYHYKYSLAFRVH